MESLIQSIIDRFDTDAHDVVHICKTYNAEEPPPSITDAQYNERPFFQKDFAKKLCEVLDFWCSDGTLNDQQKETFQVCSKFLLKITHNHSNAKPWLNQQTELINLTEKCIKEIAFFGYYIGIDGREDPSLEYFDWLLQAFENVVCQQLLGILVKCVTSHFYIDAFHRLNNVNALSLTITQHFLLITCPNYILTCDRDKNCFSKITDRMLDEYDELLKVFLPNIKQWTVPVVLSLAYPIKFVLGSIRWFSYKQKKEIYDAILVILLNESAGTPQIEEVRTPLIYTSLCLLIEIIRSDKDLCNELKNKSDNKSQLVDVLNDLSKTDPNEKLRIKALELVSRLVTEEEFLRDQNPEEVTELFVKNFNVALQDGMPEEADDVLKGLKNVVQNGTFKEEIIKQNALTSILKYAKETSDNPVPLEIAYAMTFNVEAEKVIKEDTAFVDHVRHLQKSAKSDVLKVARGIMWKLEGEEKFKEKKEDEKATAKKIWEYDMMISYSWAQQELCHQINDRLEKAGYKVWLDRDEIHGSIMESIAEAIEHSRFVLVCMSSNYKKSNSCKTEADYAFRRKCEIIPLVVEPSYKADGWLGLLAGSRIYVDFADKKGEEFDQAYNLLIAELKRNGLDDVKTDLQITPTAPIFIVTEPELEDRPPEPIIQTREYLTVGPASQWTNVHVKEFLVDYQLEQFLPICESMDGETLMEFHRSCQALPDKIYGLVNNPKREHSVSLSHFFKFISKLKKYLPPATPSKVHFRYNYTYPSSSTPPAKDTAN